VISDTTLLVRTRCRAESADPEAPRADTALLATLAAEPRPGGVALGGVASLSACRRGGADGAGQDHASGHEE